MTREAFAGIDVAFAKRKKLPVSVCVRDGDVISPLPLGCLGEIDPPRGSGNAAIVRSEGVHRFAIATAEYLRAIERHFNVRIVRIAIDAPSAPRLPELPKRLCEAALGFSVIATPTQGEFASRRGRALAHIRAGGAESRLPSANQWWMLVGFELFRTLTQFWECLEVYPQATMQALGCAKLHKSHAEGLQAQFLAVVRRTGWYPVETDWRKALRVICAAPGHDALDAYACAWIAALDESERRYYGTPPGDAIWIPRI